MPHKDIEYKYIKMRKYPHLRPEDVAIWERLLDSEPDKFKRVWYDVHVGKGERVDIEVAPRVGEAWHDLTRWKIDVVAEGDRFIYVIEIKPNANAKALGQALSYAKLYLKEFEPLKAVIPVVLTDNPGETTLEVAKDLNVQIWVI